MERNYPTGIKFRIFQAAVLSLSLLLASVSVAGCLLGDLAAEFPDAPQYLLQSFVTFPTIGGMIANVVGGASAAKVGKKNLCGRVFPDVHSFPGRKDRGPCPGRPGRWPDPAAVRVSDRGLL